MSATNPYDDQGDFLSEEELARRRALAGGAPGVGQPAPGVAPVQAGPVAALKPPPTITMPSSTGAPAVSTGVISPSQLNEDRAEQQRLQTTGSGVHQFGDKHHILGPILKALDIAGSIIAPQLAVNIPGTTMHHEGLLAQNRRHIGNDIEQQGQEATAAHVQQETEDLKNPQPGVKTDDQQVLHDLMTGQNGQPRINPDTQKPYTYLEAFEAVKGAGQKPPSGSEETKTITTDKGVQQWNPATKRYDIPAGGSAKPEKPDSPEQQFIDAETSKGVPLQKAIADYAKVSHQPQQEPGSYMPLYDEHGRVTGAWNAKTGHIAQAPQNMPGTTSAGQGIESKANAAVAKEAQPYQQMVDNAAEAHNLADMAEKGNASADVDLTLSFFKMMKGAGGAGVRFTQQEQNMILGARNAGQGLVAIGQKVIGEGQPLTPEQRKHMVAVMDMHAQAAQRHLAGMQHGQGGQGGGTGGKATENDPLGIR